jgi:hypothetical protein
MKNAVAALVAIIAGLAVGLTSAQTMMQRAADEQEGSNGNWRNVHIDADSSSGFYAASSFLRKGQLPPPRGARFYTREIDDDGNGLRGGCVVSIEGRMPDVRWWSVKIEGTAGVAALDAGDALREPDGTLILSISHAPSPGNWLKAPGDGSYVLNLVIFDAVQPTKTAAPPLPVVKRLWC